MKRKNRERKLHKILILAAASSVVLAAVLVWQSRHAVTPHSNRLDFSMSLRSTSSIPESAVKTDPSFQNLAFEAAPNHPRTLAGQLASALRSASQILNHPQPTNQELGTWVWTPIPQMTDDYMHLLLSDAHRNGLNTIYLSIDSYLDIFEMPKGVERERSKQEYEQKIETFLKIAEENSLAVHAEAGWRNWAEPGNEYKGLAVANFVKNFNRDYLVKFKGFQYDVEPYLLDEYAANPTRVLGNFLSLIDKTENFLSEENISFSVVIPDFYDQEDAAIPEFVYAESRASVLEHLLRILDRQENNSVIVMSYRGFADGFDGSIEVSQNEINTANAASHQTKIIIAQETGEVLPPYITFHKTSKKYLWDQIGRIGSAFQDDRSFGGIAIHYLNSFLALK